MTLVDLVANTGGTLGLFCGFSVLSLAEVVYWTIKSLVGKAKRDGTGKKGVLKRV